MRSDMAKVIVERPRRHGLAKPKGYHRDLQRMGEDGPPRCEGMKRRWGHGTKDLNEHLGPLRRYLDSQVGRPWDKVFSEICTHINRDSAVQDHVRDHVEDFVVRHVFYQDGVPCNGALGWGYGKPLRDLYRRHQWFVCPITGLLRRVERRPRRRQQHQVTPRPHFVKVGKDQRCQWLDGAWHLLTVSAYPADPYRCKAVDVVRKQPVAHLTLESTLRFYGAAVYATACRRLSRRELRQLPVSLESRPCP